MNPVTYLLRALIRVYQLFIAPLLGPVCRYTPSCSSYAAEALAVHGAARGTLLTVQRLCRCHPWGGSGHDPVPSGPIPERGHALRCTTVEHIS